MIFHCAVSLGESFSTCVNVGGRSSSQNMHQLSLVEVRARVLPERPRLYLERSKVKTSHRNMLETSKLKSPICQNFPLCVFCTPQLKKMNF